MESRNSQNQNNNENLSLQQLEKKRARRTRKDQDGRDFKCPCGKSYLSYPALYTHIKTKHQGKVTSLKQDVPHQKMTQDNQRAQTKEDLQFLKIFLSKFYPDRIRGSTLQELSDFLEETEKKYILPQLQYWYEFEKKNKPEDQPKILSARQVFGKLIFEINRRTNPSSIKFLVKLVMLIEKGVCAEKGDPKYFDECTASLIPSAFNQLILNKHIPVDKLASDKILQDNESVCTVLVHICNWMFNQKYTNYTVKYRL